MKKIAAVLIASALAMIIPAVGFATDSFAANLTASTIEELQNLMESNLKRKNTSFVINYTAATPSDPQEFKQSIIDAYQGARNHLPGDILWNIKAKSASVNVKGYIGNIEITVTTQFLTTIEQDMELENEIDRILSGLITPQMNNYQKEKAIHDYIVSTVEYADMGDLSHTVYSALFDKKAVCQGYAVLAYKMLRKAGIHNELVYGSVNRDPDQAHLWNAVELDGIWYMLDTTWDDPIPNGPGVRSYKYFNVTGEFLKLNMHSWDEAEYPAARTLFDEDYHSSIDRRKETGEF